MAKKTTRGTRAEPVATEASDKPLKPSQCRSFMQKRLAEEMHEIVDGFVEQAKTGSCAHVKLASELLEDKASTKKASRKNGSAEQMLEELKRM